MPALSPQAQALAGFFRECGLRFESGPNDYPIPAEVRPKPYAEQWQILTARGWYSYKLEDHSLLVFVETAQPSFSYYPCPVVAKPRHIFGREQGFVGADIYSSEMTDRYERHLETAPLRESIVPVRFDFDEDGYDERCHPIGHVHFGHEIDIRVGTDRIWNPTAFGLFILRQFYPEKWRTLLSRPTAAGLERRVRTGLSQVDDQYRDPMFKREAYLF